MKPATLTKIASVSLIALILLCLAWELWLAPLRPNGSWLVLKTLPLLAPLFGTLRGNRYTSQWASMLALAYLTEGLVRGSSDVGLSMRLAWLETLLAASWFAAAMLHARATRPSLAQKGDTQ